MAGQGPPLVKVGVHLTGINRRRSPGSRRRYPFLMPPAGRGHEESPAFIWRCGVPPPSRALRFTIRSNRRRYPALSLDLSTSAPNPADRSRGKLRSTARSRMSRSINSYNGIRTGPTENGRDRILVVHGTASSGGEFFVDWTGDIGRIENVQFHSHFWAHPAFRGNWNKVFAYMQRIWKRSSSGRTDWEYVNNTFVFPARSATASSRRPNGACNGQFSGHRRRRL